ncbi:hypothetical protein, partial [Salmonella enterica]|uniref:hypothetical protein n=1 Tax=Salmonella enterica TaxID=28901 RepID=UPI001C6081F0
MTSAPSPHHPTRHATTYRELPPMSISTNPPALPMVLVTPHSWSAPHETLCHGSRLLSRSAGFFPAP